MLSFVEKYENEEREARGIIPLVLCSGGWVCTSRLPSSCLLSYKYTDIFYTIFHHSQAIHPSQSGAFITEGSFRVFENPDNRVTRIVRARFSPRYPGIRAGLSGLCKCDPDNPGFTRIVRVFPNSPGERYLSKPKLFFTANRLCCLYPRYRNITEPQRLITLLFFY